MNNSYCQFCNSWHPSPKTNQKNLTFQDHQPQRFSRVFLIQYLTNLKSNSRVLLLVYYTYYLKPLLLSIWYKLWFHKSKQLQFWFKIPLAPFLSSVLSHKSTVRTLWKGNSRPIQCAESSGSLQLFIALLVVTMQAKNISKLWFSKFRQHHFFPP